MTLTEELNLIHRLNAVTADYQKSLALLRHLKAGTVSLDAVQMTVEGWQLVDVTALPTSNGTLPPALAQRLNDSPPTESEASHE